MLRDRPIGDLPGGLVQFAAPHGLRSAAQLSPASIRHDLCAPRPPPRRRGARLQRGGHRRRRRPTHLRRRRRSSTSLVVDDGSTDATAEHRRARRAPRVLRLPFNLGIGGAVQAGFTYAHEHGYDYMVQVDGDGQHDPAELAQARRGRHGRRPDVDMVCGSRFSRPTPATSPRSAAAPASTSSRSCCRASCASRSRDPTSGFRLYNRRAIALFARDYPHDYPEVEAVLMLHHHRLTMREVPVRMFQRGGGVSSIAARASPPTTWSRCCSRCSSASAGAAPCREPGEPARRSPRSTGSDGHPAPDRRDRRRRRRCCCSCSSSCAGARCSSATRCCGCSARS